MSEQIFDKLRFPAARLARYGKVIIRQPVKFHADGRVRFRVPADLQIEQTAESRSRLVRRRGFLRSLFQPGAGQFNQILDVIVFGLKTVMLFL